MAASGSKNAIKITRQVKPLLSVDQGEARHRVLSLYKAWFRQIPYMVQEYQLPYTEKQCKEQLRAKFRQNKHVKDLRVIDMLVVKGQQDLQEVVEMWAMETHIISKHFAVTIKERPKDFMSKFLSGQD